MKNDLWNYLKSTSKPIVLYGMGNGADKIIRVLESRGIPFKGVFASDEFVREKTFHGFKVTNYSALENEFGDMIVLLCFGSARREVLENIKKISASQELYAPDVPVYGDVLFDLDYAKRNADDLKSVYDVLYDEQSKLTFENTVRYKISGDIKYLYDCEVSEDEPFKNFFKLDDAEVFMDLGAYRGDTVKDFLNRVNSYDKIIAVEPDKKTFIKLCKECEGLENTLLLNGCISDTDGKKAFNMDSSRGSAVGSGGTEIDCFSIDGILKGEKATFIKMDIEGEEANAIKGAKDTILKHKPKMIISCYHRSEDLIEIPKRVMEIRGDYKIYMRHFPSLPAWDTCFYFV